ncbi:MAG: penicillin-binding protein 2 [bacterium]|nr:penicillin-binding protein 2 [bacterium]
MAREFNPQLLDIDSDPHAIRSRDRYSWVESSFDETGRAVSSEFLGVSISETSIRLFFVLIAVVFVLFFARAMYLQVIQGRGFALLAERNKAKTQIIPARRGILYDRNQAPLVWNVPTFTVQVTQAELPVEVVARNNTLSRLAELLAIDTSTLEERLKGKYRYQPAIVADNIEYGRSLNLSVELAEMKGVSLTVAQQRQYDSSSTPSLAHVIGYTGRISEKELRERGGDYYLNDVIGKEGLELSYEAILHGKNGDRSIEVDALGSEKRVLDLLPAIDGKNIVLALDANLQHVAEVALRASLEKMHQTRGVVIITDPRNGGIRAMVSLPVYDNNAFVGGLSNAEYKKLLEDKDRPLFDRALFGEYPAGSTIKPLVAAAALQEKIVTPAMSVRSSGGIHVGQWTFPDWKAGGHGVVNVVKALAESVNTYFYMIGGGYGDFKGLGIDRLVTYFRMFGLGTKTGVDILGERAGFVPTPEWKEKTMNLPWYIGDTYHVSIGQGDILVTPMQVNEYTQYFANNGTSYTPHFAQSIIDITSHESQDSIPQVYKKELIAPEHVQTVREGMRQTVLAGSARRLSTLKVTSAGKTGTAQWGNGKPPHAWFTGWAPYENPELAITVLVEEGVEGSRSASPVAYDIFKWYFDEKQKPVSVPH